MPSEPLICLRIAAADFLTMLSDNVQLAQGLFRMLLAPAGESPAWLPLRPAEIGARRPPVVDAAMVLVQHPLFERASAPQLLALTAAAVDVPLAAGRTLFRAGDMPAIYVVMSGEIALECPRRRAGDRSGRARRSASPRRSPGSASAPAPP